MPLEIRWFYSQTYKINQGLAKKTYNQNKLKAIDLQKWSKKIKCLKTKLTLFSLECLVS
jgi:hypothetical protein